MLRLEFRGCGTGCPPRGPPLLVVFKVLLAVVGNLAGGFLLVAVIVVVRHDQALVVEVSDSLKKALVSSALTKACWACDGATENGTCHLLGPQSASTGIQ
jgi:hypothetical protein